MDVNSTEMGGLTFRQSSILCVQFHADQKLLLGVFLALMLYDDYAVVHLAVFLSFGFCALIASHHTSHHLPTWNEYLAKAEGVNRHIA